MKPFPLARLLACCSLGLAASMSVAGCGGEDQEGPGAQYPKSLGDDDSSEAALAKLSGPGEAPTPIETVATAPSSPPPPPSAPPPVPVATPEEIVPGETTEEEYARENPEYAQADANDYADNDPSALTDFRQALDPYGSWVDDPQYGTVWEPSESVVGSDFAPYVTDGQWTYDDSEGWVWASAFDWGWAPFHYGRWAYLGSRWGWIPGRQYAGAWVTWRTGYGPWNGYLGWAPLPPAWGWRNGAAFGYGFTPTTPYAFCSGHQIFNGPPSSHVVTGGSVGAVGSSSRVYASPTAGAGGRVLAQPTVGPSPSSVGISPNEVARTPSNNRGIMHAQMFAHSGTAQSLGGHAATLTAPRYPGSAGTAVSRNGFGSAVYSRNEPVARSPQYRGIAPAPYHAYPSRSLGFASRSIGPTRSYGYSGGYGGGYGATPHYGSTYAAGRYGASPFYHGPVGAPAYGAYHTGTSHPTNSSSPSSYDDAPGWGAAHGGGGGGGFRGGGRGGGGRGGGGRR
jgi:hypothetical protein